MEYTTVTKPQNKLFEVNFKEIRQYRDLLAMFVRRDIVTQYKQTILGPTWYFIQPALTTIMYIVVFGGIAVIYRDSQLGKGWYSVASICDCLYLLSCHRHRCITQLDIKPCPIATGLPIVW
ncbi:MAG: hypothetical protein Q4A56_01590 [Porphyromonadaceae bacterium]|nr:hypothetical protein [Porphyromonadaceae bacterium]